MPATDWQKRILSQFVPSVSPIILAADPDSLLQNEHILAGLQERGFSLLWFEDLIAFRYAYESRFRGREQGDERKGLVVLAQVSAADPTRLLRHPCLFPYRLPYWAASELVASSRQLEALR